MIKSTKAESVPVTYEGESAHPGWWAAMTILITAWIGIPMALPLTAALPWILFSRRHRENMPTLAPTIRWCIAVWCTTVAMSALAGERAVRSVPFGMTAVTSARAWLEGTAGAAPSWVLMAAWVLLTAATAIPLRGVIASVVLAHALAISAIHASVILANSSNLLHASVIAIPVWTGLLLVGMIFVLDSLAAGGITSLREARSRKRLTTGAILIGLAFLTRLALANVLTSVARRVALI